MVEDQYKAILDCGSNQNLFGQVWEKKANNVIKLEGKINFPDGSQVTSYAHAEYGILKHIILTKYINQALISVGYLTKTLQLKAFYSHNKAYIIQQININKYKTIATATLLNDGLFHVDDMTKFLKPLTTVGTGTECYTLPIDAFIHLSISETPYTEREIKYGSAKVFIKSSRQYLTLLQWLHVRLGHASEAQLRWIVKNDIVLGTGVTWKELEKLELGPCDVCQRSHMRTFALPCSISHKEYDVFELLTFDFIPLSKKIHGKQVSISIRGYIGLYLYADKKTGKLMPYFVKSKSEWLQTLKDCINEYGPGANIKSKKLLHLLTDYNSEVQSTKSTEYLKENQIKLFSSTPYKQAQNLIERFVQSILNMLRAVMMYHASPVRYWCYALEYTIATYNMLCKIGNKISRNEGFSGEKPDVSICVPYYSHGWAAVTEEERQAQPGEKPLKDRSIQVIMLGYTQPYTKPDKSGAKIYVKNAYQCYVPSLNKVMIRHDCNWSISPETALSHFEPNTSNETDGVTSEEEEYDYDLLGPVKPVDDSWDPKHILEMTSTTIDTEAHETQKFQPSYLDDILDSVNLDDLADPEVPSIDEQTDNHLRLLTHKKTHKRPTPTYTNTPNKVQRQNKGVPAVRYDDEYNVNNVEIQQHDLYTLSPHLKKINLLPPPELFIPNNLTEALACPDREHWKTALETEHTRLDKRACYVPIPEGSVPPKPPIKSKYTFRITIKVDGTLKYRVRLVACGYSQIQGIDYDETYAPTAKYKSFCIIIQIAAALNWLIEGLDVEQAFIESEIDSEIYMTLPKDKPTTDPSSKRLTVVRLLKSLYGLKQAGELWYSKVKNILLADGYTCLKHDKCIFIKRNYETGEVTVAIIYVDDILYIGNSQPQITLSINHFRNNVTAITEMGDVSRYIGIDIKRNLTEHTIELSQTPYIDRFVSSTIPPEAEPKSTPMSDSIDYSKTKEFEVEKSIQPEVGQLRYLADHTKPDILAAVGLLGQVAAQPHQTHHKGIKHLARYLKGSREIPLILGGNDPEVELFGYVDASHLPDETSKPRVGFCYFLNLLSGTIYARSVKSKSVSHSSCEAEIDAIDKAAIQALWIRGFLAELGYPQLLPTILYTDSQSAKALADLCQIGNNSAHITMRINFLHEQVLAKVIELKYINTENEVADVLTKLLPVESHRRHSEILLLGHKGLKPLIILKKDRPMVLKPMFKLDKHTNKYVHKLQAAKAKLNKKKVSV